MQDPTFPWTRAIVVGASSGIGRAMAHQLAVGGAVAGLNEAAARFAVARAGTIVGLGSMAGERGRRGFPVYGATKAALHGYLESLRNRLGPRGVRVVTAKPGFVDTVMTRDRG